MSITENNMSTIAGAELKSVNQAGPQLHSYKEMSDEDFANVGIHQLAYIRENLDDDEHKFYIYSANGQAVAFADSLNHAKILIMNNKLIPAMLH